MIPFQSTHKHTVLYWFCQTLQNKMVMMIWFLSLVTINLLSCRSWQICGMSTRRLKNSTRRRWPSWHMLTGEWSSTRRKLKSSDWGWRNWRKSWARLKMRWSEAFTPNYIHYCFKCVLWFSLLLYFYLNVMQASKIRFFNLIQGSEFFLTIVYNCIHFSTSAWAPSPNNYIIVFYFYFIFLAKWLVKNNYIDIK